MRAGRKTLIPGALKSVELVTVGPASASGPTYSYQSFTGSPLRKVAAPKAEAKRLASMALQRASALP